MTETTVYLGLGSNLGDRLAALAGGVAELEQEGVRLIERSSIYETEPVGIAEQPWYLNQVVAGRTRHAPLELLERCLRIEARFGRERTEVRFGPRFLDIDILLYGDQVIDQERLTVPHPRMHERRFVLVPLVEIAPALADPRNGDAYADVLNRLDEGKKVSRSLRNEF